MPNRISEISPTPSIYFASTDEILLTTFNSLVNQTVRLRGKFLNPDGNVVPIEFTWTPPADRSQHLVSFTPGEGFLQSLEILPDLNTQRGQLWVRAAHRRVSAGVPLFVTTLAQGYVSTAQPLNWPGWNMEHSTSGRGVTRTITLTNFLPGSLAYVTVPTNAIWYVKTIAARFQADASVVDRFLTFVIHEPEGRQIYWAGTGRAVRANEAWWLLGGTASTLATISMHAAMILPLPVDTYLTEGYTLVVNVGSIQPGDQITNFHMNLEEWINP